MRMLAGVLTRIESITHWVSLFHSRVIQQADAVLYFLILEISEFKTDIQIGINPGGAPLLGHQCKTVVNRLVGAVVVDLLTVQGDGAAGLLTDPEQGLHDVGAV